MLTKANLDLPLTLALVLSVNKIFALDKLLNNSSNSLLDRLENSLFRLLIKPLDNINLSLDNCFIISIVLSIETFYNTIRIHSHCNYVSPDEYEKSYYQLH